MGWLNTAVAHLWTAAGLSRPRQERVNAAAAPPEMLLGGYSGPTDSGIHVSWQSALTITTHLRCGLLIADGISTVPCKLMRRVGDKRVEAPEHPLYDLLLNAPNEWDTAQQLLETIALHSVFTGNGYVFVNRVRGRVRELISLEREEVSVCKLSDRSIEYRINGDLTPAGSVWHMRGPSWNGWDGMDMVGLGREALGLAKATEQAHARLFGNGVQSSGVYSVEGNLDEAGFRRLRALIEQKHAGVQNSGKPFVLDRSAKWQPIGMKGVDAEHVKTRDKQTEEICRLYGVMPIMVGYSDKTATYASAEQMFLAHAVHTIRPWHKRFKRSMEHRLLTRQERADGYYIKFVDTELLRGAAKDRAEYYYRMFQMGAMSPNKILALEDEDGFDGGEKHYVPGNMAAIEDGGPSGNEADPGTGRPMFQPARSGALPPDDDEE